jgi:hypothetical protein
MTDQSEKPRDPLIEAQIERTLRPYLGIAPPVVLKAMREQLEEMLTTDPLAVSMMEKLRAHAAPGASEIHTIEGVVKKEEVEK